MQRMMGPRGFLTDAEKQNLPDVTWPLIRRILGYLTPYWKQFLLVFLTIILSAVLGLLPSVITGRIVDEALVGRNMRLLIELLLAALATLTASQLVTVVTAYLNAWISQHIIFDMKNQMYAHLQRMSHAFFTSERQGDIITRMNTDVSGVSTVISGTLSSILSNAATVVTTLVALFSMNWKMALIGILVIPLLILPTRSAGRTRWKLLSQSQAKNDELNQLINETLSVSGSMLTKLFTREQTEYERFVQVNGEVTRLALREQLSGRWFRLVMGIFTQLGP
ncbi:MAG: ABC transporter ATP-binding protein, partial [Clostridia bacterium]|nr:ABC transporter ATP-binding protein [Clostridia bacterium]